MRRKIAWAVALAAVSSCLPSRVRQIDQEREDLIRRRDATPAAHVGHGDPALGYHSGTVASDSSPIWAEVDLGAVVSIDAIALVPAGGAAGYGFPVQFQITADGNAVADETAQDYPSPGVYPYLAHTPGLRARRVRVTALKNYLLQREPPRWTFALGELIVLSKGRHVAIARPVSTSSRIDAPPTWLVANLVDGRSPLGVPLGIADSPTNGYHTEGRSTPETLHWVQVDLGTSVGIDEIRLVPAHPTDWVESPGFGFPLRFRVDLADNPDMAGAQVAIDRTNADVVNPGDSPVVVPTGGQRARFVRLTATKIPMRAARPGGNEYAFSLAELQVYAGGRNVALQGQVSASDSIEDPAYRRWSRRFLVDGYSSTKDLIELPAWLDGLGQRRAIERRLDALAIQRVLTVEQAVELRTWGAAGAVLLMLAGVTIVIHRQREATRRQVERVRVQIGRDLHDDIGSNLGGIAILSELVEKRASVDDDIRSDLLEIRGLARDSTEALRDIVWMQTRNPRSVQDLVARLREISVTLLAGRTVKFTERVTAVDLTLGAMRHLLLLFKEAIHNVTQHSAAARVDIEVAVGDGQLTISVTDDGKGFDPTRARAGHGLDGMRARAASLGGQVEITSASGHGTRLTLTVPIR